jgi:hypothetical protein
MSIQSVFAPTGAGKSTKFVCSLLSQHKSILVIEPRIANCLNLAGYMKNTLQQNAGYKTGAGAKTTRVIDYMTPKSAINELHNYEALILDEVHDTDITSLLAVFRMQKLKKPVYLVSATLPTWVENISDNHITLEYTINKEFKVNFTSNRQNITENLLVGNVIIFTDCNRGQKPKDYVSDFYDYDFQFFSAFRGSKDLKQLNKLALVSEIPDKGCLIVTNNTLSTGITIPNVIYIQDEGFKRVAKTTIPYGSSYDHYKYCHWIKTMSTEVIDIADREQRAGRGGRTCNTDYYCTMQVKDLSSNLENMEDIWETLATCRGSEYKKFVKFLLKIGVDQDILNEYDQWSKKHVRNKKYIGISIFEANRYKNKIEKELCAIHNLRHSKTERIGKDTFCFYSNQEILDYVYKNKELRDFDPISDPVDHWLEEQKKSIIKNSL